jgi:O-antigen ligase
MGVTAFGLALSVRSRLAKLLLLVTTGFMGLGMALSLSRGALVAFVGGLVALGIARMRLRNAILIGLGLLLVVLVVFPLLVQWRLTATHGSVTSQAYADLTQSDDARLSALLAGPKIFLSAPIFGIGWGHYSEVSAQVAGVGAPIVAHNWYINTLAEQGLVGAILWALLLLAVVAELRRRPPIPRSIGFAALGAYAVGSLFLEAPSSFQTSALAIIFLVAALVGDWGDATTDAEGLVASAEGTPAGQDRAEATG